MLGVSEALYEDSENSSCVEWEGIFVGKRDRKTFLHKLLVWDDKQSFTFHLFSVSLPRLTVVRGGTGDAKTHFRSFLVE